MSMQAFRRENSSGERETAEDINARLIAVAANVANTAMSVYLRALTELWYPPSYDDFVPVPANTSVRIPYNLPDTSRIKQILLMPTGTAYPSRVDVIVESFRHVPFSLSQAQPKVGPFAHRVYGGTDVIFTNADAAIACEVYIEFEIIRYDRGKIETDVPA